jgi:protein tyrosine kinase modulator
MQDIFGQILSFVWGAWRHRWIGLVVAWAVAIGGWLWVWQLPESYVARARVYVDTNTVLKPLLRGLTVSPDIQERIGLLSRTLLSRPNLEKLMRMTDLDLQATTTLERDELLTKLGRAIHLGSGRQDRSLYSITVRDPDRDTAKRIAQALITVFIESSLSGKREDSTGAQDFLDQTIKDYEARLVANQTRLANYKQKHMENVGGSGGFYRNLNSAKARLRQARLLLREEENRAVDLQRQIDGEDPLYVPYKEPVVVKAPPKKLGAPARRVTIPPASTITDEKIKALEDTLSDLRLNFTNRHPEVRRLMAQLEDLQETKAEEVWARKKLIADLNAKQKEINLQQRELNKKLAENEKVEVKEQDFGELAGMANSPVYLNMKRMMAESKSKAAGLKARVKEYQERVTDLQDRVSTIPQVEAQLKQLERDVTVVRGQHSALVKRRETARFGLDVEQRAGDVTFRVIDPPYVPLKPSEPNKPILSGLVLVASIAVGAAVSLLLSLVTPVFYDTRALATATGLPVLGSVTISLLPDERRKERISITIFAALVACLVAGFLGMAMTVGGMAWL